ncbi:MAG: photosystem II stability/assembly factor-like protein [Bacteroidales bacterium]|nr:photosystem II stability/assembly factor-like protein [Bacteroidales bacterium]
MNTVSTLFAGIIMMSAIIFLAFLLKSKYPKYKAGKVNLFSSALVLLMTLAIISVFPGCKDNNIPIKIKKKYVWAVGDVDSTNHGTILFSSDGGATWTQQGTNCAALSGISVSDVWAVDENTVWVIGNKDLILKTTDGGLNWTQITPPDQKSNTDLNTISIVGKDDVWISTSNGQVFHSTDGGAHWTDLESDVLGNNFLQGIHAIDANVVYVAGNDNQSGFIARTTDGGQTWDSIVPSPGLRSHPPIGIAATDINHVVVYGGAAHYMMTTNGGQSWVNDSILNTGGGGTGGSDINCMKMLDPQTWWGALDLNNIFLTENAGSNWVSQSPDLGGNMFLLGIDYYDRDLCVIVGSSAGYPFHGEILRTTDGGQTWKLVKQTNIGMWKVSFIK